MGLQFFEVTCYVIFQMTYNLPFLKMDHYLGESGFEYRKCMAMLSCPVCETKNTINDIIIARLRRYGQGHSLVFEIVTASWKHRCSIDDNYDVLLTKHIYY